MSWFPHTAVRVYLLPWDLPSTLYHQLTVSSGEFGTIFNLFFMCPGTPTLQLGSTLYRGIYPLPSTIKLWYPVVSLVHSLACFHVSWFPHTAVRVYLLPWDLPSTLYRLPWDLPSTLYYQLTVSSGELSTLSNLFFMCPGSPTLQLGSTFYRGIYPLPSTINSRYPVVSSVPSLTCFLCVLVPPHCS